MENIQLHNVDSVIIKKDIYADMQDKVQRFDEYEKAKCIIQWNQIDQHKTNTCGFTETVYTKFFDYLGQDETIKKLTEQLNLIELNKKEIYGLTADKINLQSKLDSKEELLRVTNNKNGFRIILYSSLAFGLGIIFTRLIF